jgi:DNA modification methylase
MADGAGVLGADRGGLRFVLRQGDALETLRAMPAESVDCCVTSPPYWGLRDYGHPGQMGQEPSPEAFVERLVGVLREVRRVLKPAGTLWLNLGDSYAGAPGGYQGKHGDRSSRTHTARIALAKRGGGLKEKDLVGIPWMTAFALRSDGWWLRSEIIWSKPNPMPESVTDRPTRAHEQLFLLSKSERYFYDDAAVREPALTTRNGMSGDRRYRGAARGRPRDGLGKSFPWADDGRGRRQRDVWTVSTEPSRVAHFAVMPTRLVVPCVRAGCPAGGVVLDPFAGSGTVGVVALAEGRRCQLIELNPEYCEIARTRLAQASRQPGLFDFAEET